MQVFPKWPFLRVHKLPLLVTTFKGPIYTTVKETSINTRVIGLLVIRGSILAGLVFYSRVKETNETLRLAGRLQRSTLGEPRLGSTHLAMQCVQTVITVRRLHLWLLWFAQLRWLRECHRNTEEAAATVLCELGLGHYWDFAWKLPPSVKQPFLLRLHSWICIKTRK